MTSVRKPLELTAAAFLMISCSPAFADLSEKVVKIDCLPDRGELEVAAVDDASRLEPDMQVGSDFVHPQLVSRTCALGSSTLQVLVNYRPDPSNNPNGYCGSDPTPEIMIKIDGKAVVRDTFDETCRGHSKSVSSLKFNSRSGEFKVIRFVFGQEDSQTSQTIRISPTGENVGPEVALGGEISGAPSPQVEPRLDTVAVGPGQAQNPAVRPMPQVPVEVNRPTGAAGTAPDSCKQDLAQAESKVGESGQDSAAFHTIESDLHITAGLLEDYKTDQTPESQRWTLQQLQNYGDEMNWVYFNRVKPMTGISQQLKDKIWVDCLQ